MKNKLLLFTMLLFFLLIPVTNVSASENIKLFAVADDNTAVRSAPSKHSAPIDRLEKGTIIAVHEDFVLNKWENKWYKTMDGYFVYSERLEECELQQDSYYTFENTKSKLFLNEYADHISDVKNHTRITTHEKSISNNGTQYFRLHFITDTTAILQSINKIYALNVTKRDVSGSKAVMYDINKDTESWILTWEADHGYTFKLASNTEMILTANEKASDVFISDNYSSYQYWKISEAPYQLPTEVTFTPRKTAPSLDEPYYSKPLNSFSTNGGKGNCCHYAYGRAFEILGVEPVFSGSATNWWNYKDSYAGYGDIPKAGSIAVWSGKNGHVAVVEEVYADGTFLISESSFGGVWYTNSYFGTRIFTIDNLHSLKGGKANNYAKLTFEGFIYLLEE